MSYLVLARKWRPQTFSDLVGQEHVSRTLKNAIDGGRVAHAFLFTGARGVGKTSSARILAKALNCEHGPAAEPCNGCSVCTEITVGNSVDVFEIDGASNTGVDDIRELRDNIKYLPSRCRFKIFIIDEVHMLSTNAFNALLKTLEEPPPHVKFIFATTEPHKVPITILSRCQRFDFKRIPLSMTVARLRYIVTQEGISISDAALDIIARKGDGSMRDSLSTLDQVLAFCGETVVDEEVAALLGVVDRRLLHQTAEAVFARDSREALEIVKRIDALGSNVRHFCQELIDYFRSLLLLQAAGEEADLLELSEAELAGLQEQCKKVPLADVQRHLTILMKGESEMAGSTFPRLVLEMALIKMATLVPVVPVDLLLERLKAMEGKLSVCTGVVASPQPHWEKSATPPGRNNILSGSETGRGTADDSLSAEGRKRHVSPAAPVSVTAPHAKGVPEPDWSGFVSFVKGKKPMLASQLEHGSPLQVSAGMLEIGFPPGSFELENLTQPDTIEELKKCAKAYFGCEYKISIKGLSAGGDAAPLSLAEKKSNETSARVEKMKEDAADHPAVRAALDIFGGDIGVVEEIDQ